MLQRKASIVFLMFLMGCTQTYSTLDLTKYRLQTLGVYGSIKRNRNYPSETLKFINTSLEERLAQFLRDEKGYRILIWTPASRPRNESMAFTTATNHGADTLLVLKSSLTRVDSSRPELETEFRLLSIPDKRVLFTGKFKSVIDSSGRVDYASVAEGLRGFPERYSGE